MVFTLEFDLFLVNDLLAAGLIGNAALTAPPVSQAPSFVLGQVGNQSQDLTQHLANLASSLHPLNAHPPRLPVSGVPPPPPTVSNGKPDVDLSISKPLAEKIRQIAEGAELRPLVEVSFSYKLFVFICSLFH